MSRGLSADEGQRISDLARAYAAHILEDYERHLAWIESEVKRVQSTRNFLQVPLF